MIVAPAGGTRPRLAISSTPYLPAPSNARCATNFEAAAREMGIEFGQGYLYGKAEDAP